MANNAAIVTQELTFHFGEIQAVSALSLSIRGGEVFGLLGHNGAGKTTTIRLLNGLLRPLSGSAQVLGQDTVTGGVAIRQQTGVLTETPSLDERLTGRDNLTIYANIFGVNPADSNPRVYEHKVANNRLRHTCQVRAPADASEFHDAFREGRFAFDPLYQLTGHGEAHVTIP